MLKKTIAALSLGLAFGALCAPVAMAQSADQARIRMNMDRDTFLKTHRFDEVMSRWVLRQGVEPPAGVRSRDEVLSERDKFLSMNRWDDVRSRWVSVGSTPRDMSKLSREQVEMETRMFTMMYHWDEVAGRYQAN